MTDAPNTPPAGWYPDPAGDPNKERYWDGASWTGTRPLPGTDVSNSGKSSKVPVIAAGIVGLVVGVAAGGGSAETKTTTETLVRVKTTTVAAVVPAVAAAPSKAEKRAEARRVAAEREREKQEAAEAKARRAKYLASLNKTITGSGGQTIKFTLQKDSVLKWTNDGGLMQIFDNDSTTDPVPVNSQAKSGKTYVEAGEYKWQMNSIGNWTLKFSPE